MSKHRGITFTHFWAGISRPYVSSSWKCLQLHFVPFSYESVPTPLSDSNINGFKIIIFIFICCSLLYILNDVSTNYTFYKIYFRRLLTLNVFTISLQTTGNINYKSTISRFILIQYLSYLFAHLTIQSHKQLFTIHEEEKNNKILNYVKGKCYIAVLTHMILFTYYRYSKQNKLFLKPFIAYWY